MPGTCHGITDDFFRARSRGWKLTSSHDKNLAVGVVSDGTARMTILRDSADPSSPGGRYYQDDPTFPVAAEAYLWYLIVEVEFGIFDASDQPDGQVGGPAGSQPSQIYE